MAIASNSARKAEIIKTKSSVNNSEGTPKKNNAEL